MGEVLEGVFGSPPIAAGSPGQTSRGEGGVCTPRKEEESRTLPPPQNGEGYSIADALRDAGVFVLAPAKQRAIAAALAAADITAQDVCDVAAFVAETEPDAGKLRKILAAVFADPIRAKLSVAGLVEFRSRKPKEAAKAYGTHQRGVPVPSWICSCSECDQARERGVENRGPRPDFLLDGSQPGRVWEFPDNNRPPRAVVSAKKAAKDDEAERQRREQFKREMRDGRACR